MPVPIRSVLFASDLTETSDEVLRGAAQVAGLAGAELHAVHVQQPAIPYYPGASETVLDMQKRLHEAWLALTEQLDRTGTREAVTSARIVFGSPHLGILERAKDVGADLIVVGAHRRRRLGDRLLGTTADRLIRSSQVPCLILRGEISLPLRQILVPTDLSEPAQLALGEAFTWATALGTSSAPDTAEAEPTEVRVVHVIPLVGEFSVATLKNDLEAELRDQVATARSKADGSAPLNVREEVILHASPIGEILRLAASGTDLLVLATHGRGALGRALIGSVASAIARQAECPILFVPPGLGGAETKEAQVSGEAAESGNEFRA